MSATGELRRLLDERGVEWWPEKYYKDACTVWRANGMEWRASEQTDGKLLIGCTSLAHLTPTQAIAATVGRGTCHAYETEPMSCSCNDVQLYNGNWVTGLSLTVHVMKCSACGGTYEYVNGGYEYCPRCGRKVVDE